MNLQQKILNAGIENCIFLVPMREVRNAFVVISYTTSNDPEIIVPAKISEKKYKIKENYKITLKSIYDSFGSQDYYISDLEKLIRDNIIEFYISQK